MIPQEGFTYRIENADRQFISESKDISEILTRLSEMSEEQRKSSMVLRITEGVDKHYTEMGEFFFQSNLHKLNQTTFDKLFKKHE